MHPSRRSLRPGLHRPGRRLAVWLGVLALCLRLLLPALHDHGGLHALAVGRAWVGSAEVANACSCGHAHGARVGTSADRSADRSAPAVSAVLPTVHQCLACDFEAFAPCCPSPAGPDAVPPLRPAAAAAPCLASVLTDGAAPPAVGRGPPDGATTLLRPCLA